MGGGGSSVRLRTVGLKSFCCRLPIACGALPCVRRFWEVGSSHLPGRCSRPPLPCFSRHLTRRAAAKGGVPAATTLGGARTAEPTGPARRMLERSQVMDPHLLSLVPKHGAVSHKGHFLQGVSNGPGSSCSCPYQSMHLAFKTPERTRFLPGCGKGEPRKR